MGSVAYASSKAALISAIKSMAIELSKKKICVNCIFAGIVKTEMTSNFLNS